MITGLSLVHVVALATQLVAACHSGVVSVSTPELTWSCNSGTLNKSCSKNRVNAFLFIDGWFSASVSCGSSFF
jgi:hypothetical protein